jgi:DNA invertase Pin-like site-specific DNA recombinase
MKQIKAVVYVRVSRRDQNPENQIEELRRYVQARRWDAVESVE